MKKALREYWCLHKLMLIPFGMCVAMIAAPIVSHWGIYLPLVSDPVDRTHMGPTDPWYGPGSTALGISLMWIGTLLASLIALHPIYEVGRSLYYQRQARRDASFYHSSRSCR
ncbi:MAG: hypothetical protein Q7S95_01810 [bacterium]|nr:hypothetical protein [bacterium]